MRGIYNAASICFIALVFSACSTNPPSDGWPQYPGSPAGYEAFIRTDGAALEYPDDTRFLIRGVSFGNHVWGNPQSSAGFTHHGPEDYARVKSMGFNAIRFYINYGLFENDGAPYVYKAGGFEWLDKNIASARTNGVYLLFNMHYPQGGFQSNGAGDALWTNASNQSRLAALWKEIARRYKDEEIIIGYGLVNEPVPYTGVSQWAALAQTLINSVREEDPYHLIFVERANWLKSGDTQADRDNLYFPQGLSDTGPRPGLVYEYHMYEPIQFTHQNASWIPGFVGKFSTYPDASRIIAQNEQWEWFTDSNPTAQTGTYSWTTLTGNQYQVTDPDHRIGRPVIQAQGTGSGGTVWIDDIVVEEYDSGGGFIQTIWNSPVDSIEGWGFWSQNGSGSGTLAQGVSGSSGNACLAITGTTEDANLGNDNHKFIIGLNNRYKITGDIRGQNVQAGATVRFRVDFYSASGDIYAWGKQYLEAHAASCADYSAAHNVPIYLGELGCIRYCFEADRGGLAWLTDSLDALQAYGINYNYHTYHESAFGLFQNDSGFPDPAYENAGVVNLFKQYQIQE